MKSHKYRSGLVALLGVMALNTSVAVVTPRLATVTATQPKNLQTDKTPTTTLALENKSSNLTKQPVTTAGISGGWYMLIFLGLGAFVFAVTPKGIVMIGDDEVGIVIKKFNLNPFVPKLSPSQVIALKGEAGPQAQILTPGMHWGLHPQIYTVRKQKVITVSPDEIGLVVAKDGANMSPGQLFGKVVECDNFQDARAFIAQGGQKGKQLGILTPGTYRINTELFEVRKQPAMNIPPGQIGLVAAKDGTSMSPGQILGKAIDCNNFQDAAAFIAQGGQKGKQLAILTPGIYQINTDLFTVQLQSEINIRQGEIGLIVAKEGANMLPGQLLGKVVECNNFQDAPAFITNGGQKGRQIGILTAGTYQINTDLFNVITAQTASIYDINPQDLQLYKVEAGKIGIVTTYDGTPIKPSEIAGEAVVGHDNFQNAQKFIDAGGCKGLQAEILPPGSWTLNPWFVKVEQVELTDVPVGTVGVIISHVGKNHEHESGVVECGYKGVWNTPLYPGKHVINTKVMNVEIVPTLPIALDWSNKEKPPANFDANLHAIKLRSKDGFCFDIEVTQVIRVAEENAPTMIYRVGNNVGGCASNSIRALIVKVLQPAVSNYFCNSAQNSEALDFLDKRSDQQRQAKDYIKSALSDFGVEAVDTLIGEIDLPNELEKILTDRKIAEERQKTLAAQQQTEKERQKLAYEEALRNIQVDLVNAEKQEKIAEYEAIANRYQNEVEIEKERQLKQIEIENIQRIVDILGVDNYADIEKLQELVKLKLPEFWVGNSPGDGLGLTDAIMAPLLRALITSSQGANNALPITNQTHKALETFSASTALPESYIICTHCNTKNQSHNNFCNNCGSSLKS